MLLFLLTSFLSQRCFSSPLFCFSVQRYFSPIYSRHVSHSLVLVLCARASAVRCSCARADRRRRPNNNNNNNNWMPLKLLLNELVTRDGMSLSKRKKRREEKRRRKKYMCLNCCGVRSAENTLEIRDDGRERSFVLLRTCVAITWKENYSIYLIAFGMHFLYEAIAHFPKNCRMAFRLGFLKTVFFFFFRLSINYLRQCGVFVPSNALFVS